MFKGFKEFLSRGNIIDLSTAADQPFRKDSLALLYNGELYNYRELRTELQAAGASFRTSSDTEVVLEAWRRWGPDALDKCEGMWAFAWYDERDGSVLLSRESGLGRRVAIRWRSGNRIGGEFI